MQVTIRAERSVALVSIVGSVDSLTAGDLQAAMAGAVEKGQTRLVADFLEQVPYLRRLLGVQSPAAAAA